MSVEPVEVLLDANGNPIETWGGKFERKFKENPFVPVRTSHPLSHILPFPSSSLTTHPHTPCTPARTHTPPHPQSQA